MVKHLLTLTLAFLLAVPAPLYAQDASLNDLLAEAPSLEFVPKPVTTDCMPNMKCLDFDNFAGYIQMRVQYVWLLDVHLRLWPGIATELKKSTEAYEKATKVQADRADRSEEAYDDLFPKYERSVQRATKAEAMSVWGGGLPWLIAFAAVGLAIGTGLGVYLETKLGAN